jgi:MinD-like ATPase involved in chromosome partitioning or flagellar assembly
MSMRLRNQPEDFSDPAVPSPEGPVAPIDYKLLRRLEMDRAPAAVESPVAPPEPKAEPRLVQVVTAWDDEDEEAEIEDDEPDTELAEGAERQRKVIVVDRVGTLATEVGRVAEGLDPAPEVLKLDRPTEIVEVAEAEDPDVIVFGLEEVTGAGLKRLAVIHRAQPKIVIVLSDNRRKTWTAAQMAASGASDFLPANPSKARLRTKLSAALSTAEQLREGGVVFTERVVIQDAPPVVESRGRTTTVALARVFTVASASGGSGKTMVASNLAAYLAKATGARVLLIDLDLQFGEIAPSLHLHPQRTIEDLIDDPEELMESVVEHSAGFNALCAPSDVLAGEKIGPDEVAAIIEVARRQFDYVVVDTPPSLNETCLAVFDQSEKIIVTANMDVPSLKNMRRYLETIEKLDVTPDKAVLLVNRSDANIGLDLQGVGQLFPQGFLAVVPVSREIPWATNMGIPLLEAKPKSDISRLLAEGFATLVPPSPGVQIPWIPAGHGGKRPGLLGRKKGQN